MDSGELREIKIATPEFEFLSKNEVRFELGLTGIRKIEFRIIRNQIVPVFGDTLQPGQSLSVMNSVGKKIPIYFLCKSTEERITRFQHRPCVF